MCLPYCCLTCEHRQRGALTRLSRPLVWVKLGSSKFVGLQKVWPDLKILEAFWIGLQVSFSGDFGSWSLELQTGKEIILDGPAAADQIQTKNKKYDAQRKHMFRPQRKTKLPWVEYDEEKGVMFCETCHKKYSSLADKS